MTVASALASGRRAAEALMLDAGQALRPTGGYAYDPETGNEVEATTPLFASRCKIQTRTLVARETEVGGRTATEVRVELHLPVDTDPLTVGDLWEMTEAAPGSTVTVGRRYRVLAPHEKSQPTARRYDVEAVL